MKTLILIAMTLGLSLQASAQNAVDPAAFQAGTGKLRLDATPGAGALPAFQQGTQRVRLTQEQISRIEPWLNNAKQDLEEALKNARGNTAKEAQEILGRAMVEVVSRSYNKNPGEREFLMRVALNQGLELAYGLPQADGSKSKPTLDDAQNLEMKVAVLRSSILVALEYYDSDLRRTQAADAMEKIVSAGYINYGHARLGMTVQWMEVIFDSRLQLEFAVQSLYQFLTVAREDWLHEAMLAQLVYRADKQIGELERTLGRQQSEESLAVAVRETREVMLDIYNKSKERVRVVNK